MTRHSPRLRQNNFDLIRLLFASPREAPAPGDWTAVSFTPAEVFTQTPGQAAGQLVRDAL